MDFDQSIDDLSHTCCGTVLDGPVAQLVKKRRGPQHTQETGGNGGCDCDGPF